MHNTITLIYYPQKQPLLDIIIAITNITRYNISNKYHRPDSIKRHVDQFLLIIFIEKDKHHIKMKQTSENNCGKNTFFQARR